MGIKQLRLTDQHQISSRISEFIGKEINVVLTNNTTVFGLLEGVNSPSIILRNKRQKKMEYLFKDISELYLDRPA